MKKIKNMSKDELKQFLIDRINKIDLREQLENIAYTLNISELFPSLPNPNSCKLPNPLKIAYDPKCLKCQFYMDACGIQIWCDILGIDKDMPTKSCKKFKEKNGL